MVSRHLVRTEFEDFFEIYAQNARYNPVCNCWDLGLEGHNISIISVDFELTPEDPDPATIDPVPAYVPRLTCVSLDAMTLLQEHFGFTPPTSNSLLDPSECKHVRQSLGIQQHDGAPLMKAVKAFINKEEATVAMSDRPNLGGRVAWRAWEVSQFTYTNKQHMHTSSTIKLAELLFPDDLDTPMTLFLSVLDTLHCIKTLVGCTRREVVAFLLNSGITFSLHKSISVDHQFDMTVLNAPPDFTHSIPLRLAEYRFSHLDYTDYEK